MPDVLVHMYAYGIYGGAWYGEIPGRGTLAVRGLGRSGGTVNATGYGGCGFGKFQFLEIYGEEQASIAGTVVPTVEEDSIVTGGNTILITLEGEAWVPAGLTFNAQRQAILDGITSAQNEPNGWNAQTIPETAVERTSDNLVTVTLPPLPTYEITSNETVTVTVPAAAVEESSMPIVATPTFQIINQTPATAVVSGTVVPSVEESAVVTGGGTLIITLTNGTWAASGSAFDAARQGIIDGIESAQSEAAGWNAEKTNVPVTAVARTSDTVVTVTLPALPDYSITANETLTFTAPDGSYVQT